MNSSDSTITEPEKEFLETVATVFNIEQNLQQLCLSLTIKNPDKTKLENASILCVTRHEPESNHLYRQLKHDDVDNEIWFLNIEPAGMFFSAIQEKISSL